MKFTFSIRAALHKSWDMFTKHPVFFIGMAFVMMVFSIFSNFHRGNSPRNLVLAIVVGIATILWSYVWIRASLDAVDGKEDLLNFRSLSAHMPTMRQFLVLLGVGILTGIIVFAGLILLVIPGIYFGTRLAFANMAFVDRQQSVGKSLSYSWKLVKGKIFWTVFLVLIIEVALVLLGALAFMVGLLVAYPVGMLLLAYLYRDLTVYRASAVEIAAE
jgi:hypothetical protein